jgi:hypothetical protein
MIVEPKREILLGPLLRAGLRRCWAARDHLLRLGVVPGVIMVALLAPLQRRLEIAFAMPDAQNQSGDPVILLLLFGCAVALSNFSVNWIRQLTLGQNGAPGLGIGVAPRHFRFLLFMAGLSLLSGLIGTLLLAALVLSGLGMAGAMAGLMANGLLWTALMVRLSPSWIGIALDAPMPLAVAWRRTEGSGFKLVLAMLAVEVPLLLVLHLLDVVFMVTGLATAAPLSFILIVAALQIVGVAAQLAVLATAFPHFLRETV